VVGLACASGGGAGGVAEVVGLVAVLVTAPTPAAAAAREELGGEVRLWTCLLVAAVIGVMGVVVGEQATAGALVVLRLL